jgi:methionine sulfoxide reductase heme-binding subunit
MSTGYQAILWNKSKKRYDTILGLFIISFLVVSIVMNFILFPNSNISTLIIRSFGLLGIVLLHIILSIGPLCRINKKFLPLLYNRRHLGVSMFLIISVHACYSIFWFHGNGNIHPILSVFTSNTHYASFLFFPFQTLGFVAYMILMLMAFTSHDFWLAALTPKVWKALHMLVYLAYFLIILHVVLGVLQLENNPITYLFIIAGLIFLSIIHIWSGYKSYIFDKSQSVIENNWQYVCNLSEIENNKAKMVNVANERIAIFKYDGKLSAVHNVCKHQNGPLGEGKVVNGCITCPWHGYQYKPQDGCSPAPFTEKVSTYQLKLDGKNIYVFPQAFPEGTFVEPLNFIEADNKTAQENFYIGWLGNIDIPTSKALKHFIIPSILIGFLFLLSFTFSQKKIANAEYRSDEIAEYTGIVSNTPFPHIRFTKSKDVFGNPKNEVLPLVNAWKFGADTLISKWCKRNNSCPATIRGTIISRVGVNIMELSEEENSFLPSETPSISIQSKIKLIGKASLRGEIIDPKCYLGAMNPGEGKPHRSCAIRCISGGIMPMVTYLENNERKYAVLVGTDGEKINSKILDFVAEPVQIEGTLYQYENWNCFYIDTQNIKRLNREF